MEKRLLFNLLITFMCIATMEAAPALPVKHQLTQPDGTTLTVYLRGDEFMHYYETVDGLMLQKSLNGFYCYAELSKEGKVIASPLIAHDETLRSPDEITYIRGIRQESLRNVLIEKMNLDKSIRQKAVSPGTIKQDFPTVGEVHGLVVLVQYQDIKLSEAATVEAYDRVMNEENYDGDIASGSVRDYFLNQSENKLKLHFDVVGPITLSQNRKYYGSAEEAGKERVDEMMAEAVKLAKEQNPDLDFSSYDLNEDGVVDFVYAIYAGYGEAQGGPEETVWPQSSTLEYKDWNLYDGLYLGRYSCSCELRGKTGSTLDGIGTFCHEFSHILGLPDIYDPRYSGCPGLNGWDVMDIGSYNNESKTPAGYTAMDKYTLGWLKPELLDGPQSVSLEALATSNKAYFLVSEKNPNEYFTFENRQNVGWDAALPGHGLLICHIQYDKGIWRSNTVNTDGFEHVSLVVADKNKRESEGSSMKDVFPGSSKNTSFTDDSEPAMLWNSGAKVGKPITNIKEVDGVITFDFMKDTGIESFEAITDFRVYSEGQTIVISNDGLDEINIYSLSGELIYTSKEANCRIPVDKGCYIVRIGTKSSKVNVR
ncbi:M6 family metalloprotease domain-containing protein [Oscillospiraceae bacterium N12]|jgi:immune inhibitor A|uniref:M6 family metalloprotease domain-containing protein n=1 Tax=Jilunia laotingensis TaxID=2763675 RepID=A0A926F724_9BACT|nr:M6 family metalloprotease domain-containing protein [Jilunia laotingensis]MBC8593089.1 M6 family metalloprotease domain-containing protein [Jilunia laotingensis]